MNYPVKYIETRAQLEDLAANLSTLSEFALDLEADVNLHRYGRKLCLAQIWDGKCCYLVDITAVPLDTLRPVLSNSNITKVMYSASFDASLLSDVSHIELKGLFDLQICSNLLGKGKRSLKHFVKEIFDIDLKKDLQTSDWFRRPLSSDQIKYASLDVRYLLEAKDIIMPQLGEADLIEQAWDASRKVENSRFQEIKNPHLRVRNSASLTPYQKVYLKEFFEIRDKIAQTMDLPTYKIMRSYHLLHLVKHPPETLQDFDEYSFFDETLLLYKEDFLMATQRAKRVIKEKNSKVKDEIIELRRLIHKHPDFTGKEKITTKRIHRFLRNFNPDRTYQNIGRTGIAYYFNGSDKGKTILLRSKIDAVYGTEASDISWSSREKHITHAFGNDGHTAILAGLATKLYEKNLSDTNSLLLFQPSGVNGKGAEKVIKDKRFMQMHIDYGISFHNVPGYPLGSIIVSHNYFTPAYTGLILKLKKLFNADAHSNQISFAKACGEIVSSLPRLCDDSQCDSQISLAYVQLGKTDFSKPPQQAEIRFLLRSGDDLALQNLKEEALVVIHDICKRSNLDSFHSFSEDFPALPCSPELNQLIIDTAHKMDRDLIELDKPLPFREDFGHFARIAPLAMFGFGAGETHPEFNSPFYDFPDELILPAIDFLTELIKQAGLL